MDRYRITAAGTLERYGCEREPIPEEEWTAKQRERIHRCNEADHPLSDAGYQPTQKAEEWWERLPD